MKKHYPVQIKFINKLLRKKRRNLQVLETQVKNMLVEKIKRLKENH